MDVETLVKTTTQELEKLVSTETIIGKPQTIAGKVIIPVSKVSFGFGAGGGTGEGQGKGKEGMGSGEGGGAGAGAGITPIAFIVVDKEEVKVYPLKSKGSIASAIESIADKCPELMKNCMETMSEMKEAKKPEKKKK